MSLSLASFDLTPPDLSLTTTGLPAEPALFGLNTNAESGALESVTFSSVFVLRSDVMFVSSCIVNSTPVALVSA